MSLTLILVVVTGLISYQAFSNRNVLDKFILYPALMKDTKQWYRFISSGFVHADWQHLLINMLVLYQFGTILERNFSSIFGPGFGQILYLILYISSIIIADIPAYFKHQNDPSYRALGASGGTSALVFAYILFNPWGWFAFPPLPALIFGIGYLLYSSYMGKRGMDNIGHDAHFWGAVYGVFFMIFAALAFQPGLVNYFLAQLMQGPSAPNF